MSQENVEIMRASYERAARGDFNYMDLLADDAEFVTSPELPDAGVYRGEAARRWIETWIDSFEGLTMEATEIIDADDKVVVGIFQQGRLRGSETTVDGRWWQVATFRDGKVIRSELFPERSAALEAAGLSE